MKIQSMFQKDIDRDINGVVQVSQDDQRSLKQELDEYIITKELRRHFATFFDNYVKAIDYPTGKIGVWISGFFGSGKSHFLKMLSYLLSNKEVDGKHAIDYFANKFDDPMMYADAVRSSSMPTETILFDILKQAPVNKDETAILRVFAKMFYRHCGFYGDDLKVEEHFVSVPEQGGGKLIPEGMCNPGQVYTVSQGKSGMIGVFRLESQMLPGSGKFERTGLNSDGKCKEAANTAFNYLKANGNRISGAISTTTKPEAEPQITEPVATEKDEQNSTPSKKPFPLGKIITAVLVVAAISWISISVSNRNKRRAAAYDAALQELSNGNYVSAEQDFSELSGYRDAASLSVYCKYAEMYKDRTDYAGGQDELSNITLQYDTGWQQDVDTLETRVKEYKAEQDAAMEAEWQRIEAEIAAEREQSLKNQYSGKLPVDGMPVSGLKYTSIGSPTETEKCQSYDNMDVHRRYKILRWYNSEGQIVAFCHSHQPKGETEEIIYAFTYYETPIGRPNSAPPWTPPRTSGGSNSGSLRDEYDSPEDLWEENRDWYEDEDEAWDEWYDD